MYDSLKKAMNAVIDEMRDENKTVHELMFITAVAGHVAKALIMFEENTANTTTSCSDGELVYNDRSRYWERSAVDGNGVPPEDLADIARESTGAHAYLDVFGVPRENEDGSTMELVARIAMLATSLQGFGGLRNDSVD